MKSISNRLKTYRWLVVIIFIGSGAISIYLFYQVPGLQILQGINEELLMTVVFIAWVMIFPTWLLLFFMAMALFEAFLPRFDS